MTFTWEKMPSRLPTERQIGKRIAQHASAKHQYWLPIEFTLSVASRPLSWPNQPRLQHRADFRYLEGTLDEGRQQPRSKRVISTQCAAATAAFAVASQSEWHTVSPLKAGLAAAMSHDKEGIDRRNCTESNGDA